MAWKVPLFILSVVFSMLILSACADDLFNDADMVTSVSGSMIHIDIEQKSKDIIIKPVPCVWAQIRLNDAAGQVQSGIWRTNSRNYFDFMIKRYGVCTIDVTDVDSNNYTNFTTTAINIVEGYNYSLTVTLGGTIIITNIVSNTNVTTNTNTTNTNFQPVGAFGIWSEITPISVLWDQDTRMDIWHDWSANMSVEQVYTDAGYGAQSWKFTGTGAWMGLGIRVDPLSAYRDMRAYTNGSLNFLFKGTRPFKVGIKDKTRTRWVTMSQMWRYGFSAGNPTNNTWVKVSIPMSAFRSIGIDLSAIEQYFMFLADSTTRYSVGDVFYFDEIYWSKTPECSDYAVTTYTPGVSDANVVSPRVKYSDLDFKTDYAYIGKAGSGSSYVYGVLKVNYTGMDTISYVRLDVSFRKNDGTLLYTDWSYVKNTNIINHNQPAWNCDTFLSPVDNKGYYFIIDSLSGFTVGDIAWMDVEVSYDSFQAYPAIGKLSLNGLPFRTSDYGGDNWYLNMINNGSVDVKWADIRFIYRDSQNRRFKWGFGFSTNILYVDDFTLMPAGTQMLFYDCYITPDYISPKLEFSDALLDWDPVFGAKSLFGVTGSGETIRQIQNDTNLDADEKNLRIRKQLDLNIQKSR